MTDDDVEPDEFGPDEFAQDELEWDDVEDPQESGESVEVAAVAGPAELTDRDREMLAFEHTWWRHAGSKEQAIRERFQVSATRYYQMLNALLDEPAALAFDPVGVGRLRRLRATRSRKRAVR